MPYRFAATKDAFELTSINTIIDNPKGLTVKKEDDFKGVSFNLIWERLDNETFKLCCYHRGIFNVMTEEFKELIETQPLSIINTIMYKELFTAEYKVDPLAKKTQQMYTSEVQFKFLELFEDEDVMCFYVNHLVEKLNWKLQIQKPGHESWENFIL